MAARLMRLANLADLEDAWSAWLDLVLTTNGQPRKRLYTKQFETDYAITCLFEADGSLIGGLKEALEKTRAAQTYHRSLALTKAVYTFKSAWTKAKRDIGALDFDDLLVRTSALLRAGEGAAAWVLYKLDTGLAHILIDEAQDTNPQQWDLLEPLFTVLEQEAKTQPRTRSPKP